MWHGLHPPPSRVAARKDAIDINTKNNTSIVILTIALTIIVVRVTAIVLLVVIIITITTVRIMNSSNIKGALKATRKKPAPCAATYFVIQGCGV